MKIKIMPLIFLPLSLLYSCGGAVDLVLNASGLKSEKANDLKKITTIEEDEDSPGGSNGGGSGGGTPPLVLQPPVERDPAKSNVTNCNQLKDYLGLNDPYACSVWHVASFNQQIQRLPSSTTYHSERPSTIADFNLWDTYDKYTGKNVKIHVSDNGTQHNHPDLFANYTKIGSRRYTSSGGGVGVDNDPQSDLQADPHGTPVAGLIAAVGNNGVGLFGVAYEATFSADAIISNQSAPGSATWKEVYKRLPADDIVNWSWGYDALSIAGVYIGNFQVDSPSERLSLLYGANTNHISYFKSSGNDGRVRGPDANMDSLASLYPINSIAALNTSNGIINYSTPGANITLSGHAHKGGSQLGTCTTLPVSSYWCGMNGTSSASPTVAGVAAVVMQALKENPKMSVVRWSDLAWVLISTANKDIGNRENHSSHYSGLVGGEPLVPKITNSFGLTHSFDFGFGIPNIKAAIQKAESMTGSLGEVVDGGLFSSAGSPQTINSGSCASHTVTINKDFQIWSLEIGVSTSGMLIRDLAIFLKMPGDKTALIKNTVGANTEGPNILSYSQLFKANAPLGMNANETWEVKICHNNKTQQTGTFHGAKIRLFGFDDLNTLK